MVIWTHNLINLEAQYVVFKPNNGDMDTLRVVKAYQRHLHAGLSS